MKGIERSERFEGERAAGAAEYLIVEAHEAPPTRSRGEQRVKVLGLAFRRVPLDGGRVIVRSHSTSVRSDTTTRSLLETMRRIFSPSGSAKRQERTALEST
jgi:hypothetical protein